MVETRGEIAVEQLPVALAPSGYRPRNGLYRVPDLAIAFAILIFTLPLILVVMLAIKCSTRGPVFCREERMGLAGQRFLALRFRTTMNSGDRIWPRHKRLTAIGQFLRYSRIDELPELINVLRGELRVIGARGDGHFFPGGV
jgi:lipopolysaccharide/colanic/teichoic acid biosynthesis glycosyltransferase